MTDSKFVPRLLPGRYACEDDLWTTDYICVADVKETAASFTIKLDIEASVRLWLEKKGLSWEEFDGITREKIIDQRRRYIDAWTPFKDGRLVIRKAGSRHPLYVKSDACFWLNPYWGGICYEFNRM